MAETSRKHPTDPTALNPAAGPVVWQEMSDSSGQVRPHWLAISGELHRWSIDERAAIAASAGRQIDDLGTTFNVFSDVGGAGQPYQLDPVPLVIPRGEWERVSAGLAQRIRLLDAVLADLYGAQVLLRDGLVPPDLVYSNPAFLNWARGVQPVGGRFLLAAGFDLVRSPGGSWMVLRDQCAMPGGLGQALENRKVVSGLMGGIFEDLDVAPLGGFMEHEADSLARLSVARREGAHIVFLTPGFRHPSYFEHAYKARMLGFPLVEAADLTVRERRLFLKTLGGLRRVDVVVCRVDHAGLDPLEQRSAQGSGDGVPGIIEAWRTGNVALANAPGSGFGASPALMPFLPRICREWLGEELLLPFVETWWLGQEEVRKRVLADLSRYILLPAAPDGHPLLPLQCSGLSPAARKQWTSVIQSRPYDFVVQAEVRPSEAPTIEGRLVRQRPVTWRGFALLEEGVPMVMCGGLARVGKHPMPPQLWPGHAGFTKDVWISGAGDPPHGAGMRPAEAVQRSQPQAQEVPSRIAEQLFWVGRYAERVELATRLLRVALRCLGGESGRFHHDPFAACLALMTGAGLLPDGVVIHPARAMKTLSGLIHDPAAGGGIPALTRALLQNAAAARDRLSDDTWRFFNRLESLVNPPEGGVVASDLARTLDHLVLHLAAFAGMQAENMTRGHGWRFLEVGRRVERALGGLALLGTAVASPPGFPVLDPLLETCDSVMTYRRRHFSRPRLDPVIELIFADPSNPRSVIYQLRVIEGEVARFPGRPDFGLMPRIREQSAALVERCVEGGAGGGVPDFEVLAEMIEHFSDLLTQHFFSHSVRRVY